LIKEGLHEPKRKRRIHRRRWRMPKANLLVGVRLKLCLTLTKI